MICSGRSLNFCGKKASSPWESKPGRLWLELPVLCHKATTAGQPPAVIILYMYCSGDTECSCSGTPGSHSVCACQNSVRSRPDISLHQEGPMLGSLHAEVVIFFPSDSTLPKEKRCCDQEVCCLNCMNEQWKCMKMLLRNFL